MINRRKLHKKSPAQVLNTVVMEDQQGMVSRDEVKSSGDRITQREGGGQLDQAGGLNEDQRCNRIHSRQYLKSCLQRTFRRWQIKEKS